MVLALGVVVLVAGYFASSRLTRTAAASNRLATYRLVTTVLTVPQRRTAAVKTIVENRATTATIRVPAVARHGKPVTVLETRLVPTVSIRTVTTARTVKSEPIVVTNTRTVTKEHTVHITTTVESPPPPPPPAVTVVQTLPVTVTVLVTTTVPPPKKHK
jgi:hypothetical protein